MTKITMGGEIIYAHTHNHPDDYQTLGDCIDDYLVRVHGWDGDIASLRTIRLVKQK